MTSVASVTNPYGELGLALKTPENDRTELGQQDFLRLMTTQLQYQDPFKPMESGEFLGQMAQFSTVSGIQSMQESLATLSTALTSSQSLQAAALVGHGVMVPGDSGYLFGEDGLVGAVNLESAGRVSVEITDGAGQVVRRLDLGEQPAGEARFSWDGLDAEGEAMPEGSYGLKATVTDASGSTAASTQALALVQSVSLGSQGVTLNLYGMDPVSLAEVREIL